MPDHQHVLKIVGREHITTGLGCWCLPDIYRLCQQCDGSDDGCWHCLSQPDKPRKGLILVTFPYIHDMNDEPFVILHSDPTTPTIRPTIGGSDVQ